MTRGLRDWLLAMQVSLAFTTYQHGRLILLGVGPDGRLSVGKQDYRRAMGLHYENGTLHLASAFQVWRLENMLDPGQYANAAFDSVLVPRVAHTTGYVDAHDLSVDRGEQQDRYASEGEEAADLRRLLDGYEAAGQAHRDRIDASSGNAATPPETVQLDPAQEQKLRALGYLE